jgi:plasmid stability protein
MKYLTVRNLPADLANALEQEKRRRGKSLNQTALELLAQALGVAREPQHRGNGLAALAGGWSSDDLRSFEASVAVTEQVDEELWR